MFAGFLIKFAGHRIQFAANCLIVVKLVVKLDYSC